MFYCKLKNCVNWIKTSPLIRGFFFFCFKNSVSKGFLASHISKRRFWFHTPRSTRQHHPHIMGYFIPRPRTISWRKKWTSISHEGSTSKSESRALTLSPLWRRIKSRDLRRLTRKKAQSMRPLLRTLKSFDQIAVKTKQELRVSQQFK